MPDKTQLSACRFLEQVIEECPESIEQYSTDNGKESEGTTWHHAFMQMCVEHCIEQRFTRIFTPRTNSNAERLIRTLMELWHEKNMMPPQHTARLN
ncbi:MAG: hypothetical protein N3B18_00860 [Desulfobacterota bacterium]|nr:hypothetical protein [Thermodesulfobacteriota bacterium]